MKKNNFKEKVSIFKIALLVLTILFSGCFNQENGEKAKQFNEVKVIKQGEKLNFKSEKDMAGLEVYINGKVEDKRIENSAPYLKMVNYVEGRTIITLGKLNSETEKTILSLDGVKIEDIISVETISIDEIEKKSKLKRGIAVKPILLGDFNNDGEVNIYDMLIFKTSYGVSEGEKDYNTLCDIAPAQKGTEGEWKDIYCILTGDSTVGLTDFVIFAYNFGKTAPINKEYNVNLKSFSAKEAVIAFSNEITSYSTIVKNEITELNIEFSINDSENSVEINREPLITGKTDFVKTIALIEGENTLTIAIKSVDNKAANIYTFKITREKKIEAFEPPANVKAVADVPGSIKVSWNSVLNAKGYKLVRSESESGIYSELGGSKIVINYKTSWSKVNIHYKDDSGVWTKNPGVPMTGSNGLFKIELKSKTAEICFNDGTNWDSFGSKNYIISGYGVYEISKDVQPKKIGETGDLITATSYIDIGLGAGKKYFYKVKAVSDTKESDYSAVVSAETETMPAQLKIYPYLTWNKADMASNGIVINYGTDIMCQAKVEYGKTETLGESSLGEFEKINDTLYLQHVVIGNLEPGTKYFYRVIQGSQKSQLFSFKTAELNDKKYRFFIAGDMQDPGNGVQRWRDTAKEMKKINESNPVDFFVCVGDMPVDDTIDYWISFFEMGKEILPYFPMMPVLGNHDTDGTTIGKGIWDSNPTEKGVANFKKFFKHLPVEKRGSITSDGSYYSFNYGSAQFSGLNTEVTYMGTVELKNDAQYAWIKDKIEKESQNYIWNFAYWHIPAYNAAKAHHNTIYKVKPITETFDSKIDWVINGHVHSYQRFKPLRYDGKVKSEYGTGAEQGVGYMIIPPAGNVPRSYEWNSEEEKLTLAYPKDGNTNGNFAEVGFGVVDIDDKTINIKVYGIGNTSTFKNIHIMDEVKYTK
jgi:acid phosphatase type 7